MSGSSAVQLQGLAPRTVRLAAVFVDLLFVVPVLLVWAVAAGSSLGLSFGVFAKYAQKAPLLEQAGTVLVGTLSWLVFAASSVAVLCLLLYQWFLLSTRGQTIGKRVFGIRIVDLQGKPTGFVQALLLRNWVFYGLASAVIGFAGVVIPLVGTLLYFLDYVPLMGDDRRCLHDYVAGTQVRWVRIIDVRVGRLVGVVASATLLGLGGVAVMNRETLVPMVQAFRAPKPVPALLPVAAVPTTPTPMLPVPVVAAPMPVPVPTPLRADVAPPPEPTPVPAVEKKLFQFTDDQGVLHLTDELSNVPEKYRSKVTTP